ncbi:MAG: sodium:solute symporter family protein [bacterium]
MNIPLIIVMVYLAAMLLVGFLTNRFLIKSSKDYLLAGRGLPWVLVAASLVANNAGGGSTVGVAGKAFGSWGLSAGWYVLAAAIGMLPLIIWAPALRRTMAYTIPEVVGRRFGRNAYLITAVFQILSLFFLTSSQILASGTIIAVLTGMPLKTAIIMAGLITMAYTVMGGLWADAFTDLFQLVVIIAGLGVSLPFLLGAVGGWSGLAAVLPPDQMSFTRAGWGTIVSLIFMYFITFLSGSEMVTRMFAAKDENHCRKAAIAGAAVTAFMAFIPAIIGLVALARFPGIEANSALVTAVFNLAPGWAAGMVCAGVIAATMSSADTNMLCASTIFTKDIYQKFVNPNASDSWLIRITRFSNVFITICGMFIAFYNVNIITMNTFAFMLRAAGPFAAFSLGLIWPRASRSSGLISIISGSIIGLAWQFLGEPFGIMSIIAGAFAGVLAFAAVTWIEKKPAPGFSAGLN